MSEFLFSYYCIFFIGFDFLCFPRSESITKLHISFLDKTEKESAEPIIASRQIHRTRKVQHDGSVDSMLIGYQTLGNFLYWNTLERDCRI